MTMRKTDSKTTINLTASPTEILTEEAAAAILAEIQAEDPGAICPTPGQLVDLESQGMTWNFETGQAEADCILIGGLAIPIVGTVGDGGSVQLAPWFSAKMGGGR